MKKMILLLLLTVLINGCNKEKLKTETTKDFKMDKVTMNNKEDKIVPHATSLPPYMSFILSNSSEFEITEKQKNKLLSLKKVIRSKAHLLKDNISEMNAKLKQLSLDNVDIKTIEDFNEELTEERLRFADIKTACRDSVLKIITDSQWNKIVKTYEKKMPYKIENILERITPIPNYMISVYHVDNLNLTEKQQTEINNWNKDGHYDAMMMQNNIVLLEKEVRKMSLENIAKDKILTKVKELENLRSKFLLVKTQCRDYMVNNVLTEEQWSLLITDMKNKN